MPIKFTGLLENVEGYNGKNGFGANVTISAKIDRKTKRLEFRTSSQDWANKLENMLDTEIEVEVMLEQNNFGIRFGEIINVSVA